MKLTVDDHWLVGWLVTQRLLSSYSILANIKTLSTFWTGRLFKMTHSHSSCGSTLNLNLIITLQWIISLKRPTKASGWSSPLILVKMPLKSSACLLLGGEEFHTFYLNKLDGKTWSSSYQVKHSKVSIGYRRNLWSVKILGLLLN